MLQALLTGSAAPALCALVAAAARGLADGRLRLENAIESLEQLLVCINNLSGMSFKTAAAEGDADSDGWGGQQEKAAVKVKGRVVMAGHAVPAVLDALLLIQ